MNKWKHTVPLMMMSLLLAVSCAEKDNGKSLQGTWKLDSVYLYDNGFGFTKKDLEEEPLHHYHQKGKLKMTRGNETRWFGYEQVQPDSLIFRDQQNKIMDTFTILQLKEDKLVLKKKKHPVFSGPGQNRFEIRYFSKVTEKGHE